MTSSQNRTAPGAFALIPKEAPFDAAEYTARLEKVQSVMRERGLDVLLVQHPPNVCYLSGYYSKVLFYNECVIVPAEGPPVLLVLGWEEGAARVNAWLDDIVPFAPLDSGPHAVAALLNERGLAAGRIGLELWSAALTARRHAALTAALQQAFPSADLVDASGAVEEVRLIKSAQEIAFIREAARLSDLGARAAIDTAAEGRTDNEVTAAAYAAMIAAGGEFMAFDPLVLSGPRSGVMHISHKRVPLRRGDPVVLEFGAVYQRYVAPIQRTMSIGEPAPGVKRLAHAAQTAFANIVSVLRPGASFDDVRRAGAEGVALAGDDVFFHHGYAYSVGVAFPPNWVEGSLYVGDTNPLGAGAEPVFQEGMVLNVPMSLRVLGQYGAMVGEAVLVTRSSCEPLSQLDRRIYVK